MGQVGICFKYCSVFFVSFLAALYLFDVDNISIANDMAGLANKGFAPGYLNAYSPEHYRCIAVIWPSHKINNGRVSKTYYAYCKSCS